MDKKKLYPEIISFSDRDDLTKDYQKSRKKENHFHKGKTEQIFSS
jgi:hypothetical protein